MKAPIAAALTALAVTLLAMGAFADVFSKLSSDSQAKLGRGEMVVRTQDMSGSNWPAVTLYQLVDATPEEAVAVFTDYASQAGYLGDCCGVVRAVVNDPAVGGDPRVQRVLYEIKVPVFANDQYELVETLSQGEGGTYSVSWRKVGNAGRTDNIIGRAYFEPHGNGTLFLYDNFIKMTAFGSGLFAGQALEKTKTTVDAMARRMEQLHERGGPDLQANLARLRAALGG